ncbi:hypothetical protein D3C78_553840 [compost metagenome]
MDAVRRQRSLIAWVLYGCILLSALACAIGHGHMSGMQLNGIGGLYCSTSGHIDPAADNGLAGSPGHAELPALDCPLCGAFIVGVAALFFLAWLIRPGANPFRHPAPRRATSPRHNWPPANPRAP